jgi:uracil-DNA glycosylase
METPQTTVNVQIEEGWKTALSNEFQQKYFSNIKAFLLAEKNAGKTVYPPGPLIFKAFNNTPFDQVKVVILGQDPYINQGEAMGLCFSVPKSIKTPPSLVNIYKEIKRDLGLTPPPHGDLTQWSEQGVLMLNSSLTFEAGKSTSHAKCGWVSFTDAVIKCISEQKEGIVFMLWGNYAKGKKILIDTEKHLVLESAHPSPLAGNAFQGCGHFSKSNDYLIEKGKSPIDWTIVP